MAFLNSIRQVVFKTRKDFEHNVIDKLNSIGNKSTSQFYYKYYITTKYIVIRCSCCKTFAFWFKNVDKINVESLVDAGNENLNLIFYRLINQNHSRAMHDGIVFNKIVELK